MALEKVIGALSIKRIIPRHLSIQVIDILSGRGLGKYLKAFPKILLELDLQI
jgi:hypothetical protein